MARAGPKEKRDYTFDKPFLRERKMGYVTGRFLAAESEIFASRLLQIGDHLCGVASGNSHDQEPEAHQRQEQ